MEPDRRASLRGLHVVSFESRRAKEMAELIRRYGGEPVIAPSMREIPLSENKAALALLPQIENGKFDLWKKRERCLVFAERDLTHGGRDDRFAAVTTDKLGHLFCPPTFEGYDVKSSETRAAVGFHASNGIRRNVQFS